MSGMPLGPGGGFTKLSPADGECRLADRAGLVSIRFGNGQSHCCLRKILASLGRDGAGQGLRTRPGTPIKNKDRFDACNVRGDI